MMQRLRDALLRDFSDQHPSRQLRPNELRRDVAREERLRREPDRTEPSPRRPRLALEEQRPQRDPALPEHPAPARAHPPHVSALKTRSGLRQAWLLREILAPPMGLRGPLDGDNDL